jgi:predicted acylesterase/phospholipase RssA
MSSASPRHPRAALQLADLADFHTLVFAGGGNRCIWQAGALTWLRRQGWALPRQLVGTSAGAGVAAALITHNAHRALAAAQQLYDGNAHLVDRAALRRWRLRFGHAHIYPAWIASYVNADTFAALRDSASRLRVAITRPAVGLGVAGSVLAGTLAYVLDKHLAHSIHPRLPRWLGLRQAFYELQGCADVQQAQQLLYAAGAAAPFMPTPQWQGSAALDGGYTDNAPIPPQSSAERARTLVLLTRHYPLLPTLFRWRERCYWQPSQRVPVSTFGCTPTARLQGAWDLGEADARTLFG